MARQVVLIAHDIRSTHNVGSLLRTAEGLGVECVYLTGYTPYPAHPGDRRLGHLAAKIDRQIHKTALGAEHSQPWQHAELTEVIDQLIAQGYTVAALEQTPQSHNLNDYRLPSKIAFLVGNEVTGLTAEVLPRAQLHLQIPMYGQKESFNVAQAAAMALYQACLFKR